MQPIWTWTSVDCALRFEKEGKQVSWNLSPSISLGSRGEGAPEPEVRVEIEMDKKLLLTSSNEWHWHKSWNLPTFTVRLQARDPRTGEYLLPPSGLQAQIYAVKTVGESPDEMYLSSVGIRGESVVEMKEHEVSLPLLKFATTSYNNDGSHFRLVVVLYMDVGEDAAQPSILWSRISPPIFVDSRNNHCDSSTKRRGGAIFDAFPPELLSRPFFKRKCVEGVSNEVAIGSDLTGLVNFFTAPNIRQKCRHPLFLVLRFPQALSLYYNSEKVSSSEVRFSLVDYLTIDKDARFLEELHDAMPVSYTHLTLPTIYSV
eukprot:TRINITY_DN9325_c0_g1_i4.p1 TRINITY_DN9325_c0_g1~~TRINITY_DN9325_c0_g1_i4.p1  ORF type:complete len:315 (-),score=32.05 TRINITY_DN9325_c0_g1_i4:48-992(-)